MELVGRGVDSTQQTPATVQIEAAVQPFVPQLAAETEEGWTERTSLFGEPEA